MDKYIAPQYALLKINKGSRKFAELKYVPHANHHSILFLAHLSRRLIGELIEYPSSSSSSSRMFKYILLRNRLADQSQNLCGGGTKFCSRHLGHMTKKVAMPIYGKNLQKSSSPKQAG